LWEWRQYSSYKNDPILQGALDTDTEDQAVLRLTADLSREKACEAASDSTTAVSDNHFAAISMDRIVTEEILKLSENDKDATNIAVLYARRLKLKRL
jgi:hypothetical protein